MGHYCGQKHTKTRSNTSVFSVSILVIIPDNQKSPISNFRNPKRNIPKYSVFFCERWYIFPKMYQSPKLLPKCITFKETNVNSLKMQLNAENACKHKWVCLNAPLSQDASCILGLLYFLFFIMLVTKL